MTLLLHKDGPLRVVLHPDGRPWPANMLCPWCNSNVQAPRMTCLATVVIDSDGRAWHKECALDSLAATEIVEDEDD